MQEVAKYVSTDHTDITLSAHELMDSNVRAATLHARDLPLTMGDFDSSLYLLFRAIRQHSTVALSGEAADELFGGYKWQAESMRPWRAWSWPGRLFRSRRWLDRKFGRMRHAPFKTSTGNSSASERNLVLRALSPELNFLQTRIFDRLEPVTPLGDRAFLGACLYDLYSHLQDLLNRHDRLS
ncbi:MAG: hypothetical protein E5V56_08740, partial [Mesorhizobium sp.]